MDSALVSNLLDQPLLTKEDLARKLNVSPDTIQTWTIRKKIPHFRLGHKTVRYSYPAVIGALGKYYTAPETGWTRKLPKRRVIPRPAPRVMQLSFPLEESGQMLLF